MRPSPYFNCDTVEEAVKQPAVEMCRNLDLETVKRPEQMLSFF
jgi:hypothetical protein